MDWRDVDNDIDEYQSLVRPFLWTADWDQIREKAAEVHAGFKGVRYPTKQQREEAWARFKALEREAFARRTSEQRDRRARSAGHRNYILRQVENARPVSVASHSVV